MRIASLFPCVLALAFLAAPAAADSIGPGDVLRADFDLSGETPSGPYDILAVRILFGSGGEMPGGESLTTTAFDEDGTTLFTRVSTNGAAGDPAINSLTITRLLNPAAVSRGFGFVTFEDATADYDISGVQVRAATGDFSNPDWTDWVDATFAAADPIPEPSTWALFALGAAGIWIARRRRRSA